MATKPKTTITPRAKYPDKTEKFLTDVKVALETLDDEVGSLSENTRSGAYKNFLESYRDALIPLWNPARFASVKTVLETVANPQMTDLAVMARHLQPITPSSTIVKEKKMTPDLETVKQALKDKFPDQSLPNKEVCAMIGNVFEKLSMANKAYAEAAELLADLSSLVTPEQYTMLLTATTARCFFLLFCLCKLLETGFLVPALFGSRLHLLSEGCALVWGMFVRGCACRDLCQGLTFIKSQFN